MFGIKGDTIAKLGTISQVRNVGYEPLLSYISYIRKTVYLS